MKRIYFFLIIVLSLFSCEDVIEVDAPSEPPRLTVDALIRLDTSVAVTTATIKVGLSSSFFDSNDVADVDQMIIQNLDYEPTSPLDQNFIIFRETEPGVFQGSKNTSFFTSGNLFLNIEYGEERYLASTRFVPSVPIDDLEQGDGTLFTGDETEIKVSFTDNADRDDFYLFDFDFDEYLVTEDEFYQGQTFEFSYFYDDGIEAGRTLEISILGVDEPFYNYMNQLIVQSGGDQGPFQTPAATVRGNIINVTDIDNMEVFDNVGENDNFALGYFAVVQEFKETITIE
ncbi:DUF4249 family protein [Maribacter aestuarii]|uniref:DUF4249 family protein n=1 Tax=Maribacter aestuarii TaxID=1130723 RepID=UPI00248BDECE|nr:DUF4249 family protein [Maribacter aestuarii]